MHDCRQPGEPRASHIANLYGKNATWRCQTCRRVWIYKWRSDNVGWCGWIWVPAWLPGIVRHARSEARTARSLRGLVQNPDGSYSLSEDRNV